MSNFSSNNFSIVETGNNEVGGSYLIGDEPIRGIVTSDNSLLYVSNFGSDTVSVYAIDEGRVIGTVQVGSHPDGLALSPNRRALAGGEFALGRCRRGADGEDPRQFQNQRGARAGHADSGWQSAQRHRDQGLPGRVHRRAKNCEAPSFDITSAGWSGEASTRSPPWQQQVRRCICTDCTRSALGMTLIKLPQRLKPPSKRGEFTDGLKTVPFQRTRLNQNFPSCSSPPSAWRRNDRTLPSNDWQFRAPVEFQCLHVA